MRPGLLIDAAQVAIGFALVLLGLGLILAIFAKTLKRNFLYNMRDYALILGTIFMVACASITYFADRATTT